MNAMFEFSSIYFRDPCWWFIMSRYLVTGWPSMVGCVCGEFSLHLFPGESEEHVVVLGLYGLARAIDATNLKSIANSFFHTIPISNEITKMIQKCRSLPNFESSFWQKDLVAMNVSTFQATLTIFNSLNLGPWWKKQRVPACFQTKAWYYKKFSFPLTSILNKNPFCWGKLWQQWFLFCVEFGLYYDSCFVFVKLAQNMPYILLLFSLWMVNCKFCMKMCKFCRTPTKVDFVFTPSNN